MKNYRETLNINTLKGDNLIQNIIKNYNSISMID